MSEQTPARTGDRRLLGALGGDAGTEVVVLGARAPLQLVQQWFLRATSG